LTGELGPGSPLITGLAAAGGIGLVIAFGRILTGIHSPVGGKKFVLTENMLVIILIAAGIVFNILIAFIPGILLTPLGNLLNAFTRLPR
jgi:hypothetical protein